MEKSSSEDDEWAMFKDVLRYLTLPEIEERYHITGIISQNRNASVRVAIHNTTGEQVAIKILNKSSLREQHKKLLLYREIRTLQLLGDCKQVTELYDVIDSGDRIWVVMEFASGGELFDFVKAKAPLADSVAREVFRPIVKVVAYMHSMNLVHRDLKLENILLDNHGRIRLADFGFSRFYDPTEGLVESICGTPHYSPPEIIRAVPHNPVYVDSWSLGIILYVLFFGVFPFKGLSIPELLQNIQKAEYEFPFPLSEMATDLVTRLVNSEPSDRLTSAEVLKHPWLNKNRLPKPAKKDHTQRLNRAVLDNMKNLRVIEAGEEDTMSVDQQICYRLIRRRYQLGVVPLPNAAHPKFRTPNIPEFHQIEQNSSLPLPSLSEKEPVYPTGPPSNVVRSRIPDVKTFLRIVGIPRKASTSMQRRRPVPNTHASVSRLKKGQTMRFRNLTAGPVELPRMNCQHTTLDSVEKLWSKILAFMEKEDHLDIISEHNYALYCKISEPCELEFSLVMGCVHPGFGLIGFSLQRIKGDVSHFRALEVKLSEYLGF